MCYQIVLADDYAPIRQCLRKMLANTEDLEIVAEANDGKALLDLLLAGSVTPDLIIVDISMPKLGGFEVIPRIKALFPHIKMLVFTEHKDEDHVAKALNLGVVGYLLKSDAYTELMPAIGKIRQGATYLSSCLAHVTD